MDDQSNEPLSEPSQQLNEESNDNNDENEKENEEQNGNENEDEINVNNDDINATNDENDDNGSNDEKDDNNDVKNDESNNDIEDDNNNDNEDLDEDNEKIGDEDNDENDDNNDINVSKDDNEIENENESETANKISENNANDGESDREDDNRSQVGELIADIFGDSDDSEAEFEGFVENNSSQENRANISESQEQDASQDGSTFEREEASQDVVPDVSSDEDGDEPKRRPQDDIVYDFDLMLQRKREENYRRKKRKNIDIINDNDDVIAEMIQQMKTAADEDFEFNKNRMTATRKLKMLPVVVAQLRKLDLREAFLDAGVLGVITDWLTRLPDGSLPHLQIRSNMLKILGEFNIDDVERIKASGIGKAVMYLMKHPKETKENKKQAGHLIACWSRPIFNLDTDFHSMSKDEREKRDFEHMNKTKRMRSESTSESEATPTRTPKTAEEKNPLKPGEKGWVPRARVPMPSMKDYVVRPKSNIESDINRGSGSKRSLGRFDTHMRNFREKKKLTKVQRAVPISIEGRKMAL